MQPFSTVAAEQQDRIIALVAEGRISQVLRELIAIIVHEHETVVNQLKRLQATSPNLPMQYAALQAEAAVLNELETFMVDVIHAIATQET